MNKFDASNIGGHPITLDDLEFLQNALAEGIKGVTSPWQFGGSDAVILSGINGSIVGLNTVYTSGYIAVNGEIYYVPGATVVSALPQCIDIAQTVDANGDVSYEDLLVHSTYLVRQGLIKNQAGAPTEIDLADFISASQRIISLTNCVVNLETSWTVLPTLSAGWSEMTTHFGATTLRYRKNKIGEVEFRGMIQCIDSPGIAFTMPVGFRPVQSVISLAFVSATSGGTADPKRIIVYPNGDVSINTNNPATQQMSLDLLRYPTT